MAISISNLTAGNVADSGSNNIASGNTASVTPSVGSILMVAVGNAIVTAGTAPTVSISGLGLTWNSIDTVVVSTNTQLRASLFWAFVGSSTSGVITVTPGSNVSNLYWIVDQLKNTVSTNAIVQHGTNSGSSSPLTTTLGAFSNTLNATYGCYYCDATVSVTAGSGFSIIGAATSSHTIRSEFASGNQTSVSFTFSNNPNSGMVAAEIQALTAGGSFLFNFL